MLPALLGIALMTQVMISEALSRDIQEATITDQTARTCRLVVNRDMNTGNPCIEVTTDSDRPYPVVREVVKRDDTTINITVYLPYALPTQNREPFDIGSSPASFHIYISYSGDTAHYYARTTVDLYSIVLQPLAERDFVKPMPVKYFPEDVVVVQLVGNDDRLRRELKSQLAGLVEETTLRPGYYHGIPAQIREIELGGGRFNETITGRLLVMKSSRPLNPETLGRIGSIVDERDLSWYFADTGNR